MIRHRLDVFLEIIRQPQLIGDADEDYVTYASERYVQEGRDFP